MHLSMMGWHVGMWVQNSRYIITGKKVVQNCRFKSMSDWSLYSWWITYCIVLYCIVHSLIYCVYFLCKSGYRPTGEPPLKIISNTLGSLPQGWCGKVSSLYNYKTLCMKTMCCLYLFLFSFFSDLIMTNIWSYQRGKENRESWMNVEGQYL